jgi:hypothetical protein
VIRWSHFITVPKHEDKPMQTVVCPLNLSISISQGMRIKTHELNWIRNLLEYQKNTNSNLPNPFSHLM